MFFHSHATTLPCESPFTLSHNQPGAETRLQHLYTWLVDVIMYKSSIQRIHSSRKCNYSLSFNHIPQAHCHTSTLPTRYTEISCCFYMFNRPLHAYNAFTVPPHNRATLLQQYWLHRVHTVNLCGWYYSIAVYTTLPMPNLLYATSIHDWSVGGMSIHVWSVQPCWLPTPTDSSIHVVFRLTQRATPTVPIPFRSL